jgi:hypothetical protein
MTCNGVDTHSPDGWASRDFLLFFIVDQSKPLLSTKVDLSIKEDRKQIRSDMFKEQIQPSGLFKPDLDLVISTGNGTAVYLGWINSIDEYDLEEEVEIEGDISGMMHMKLMNEIPPLNRGLSWVFEQVPENDE